MDVKGQGKGEEQLLKRMNELEQNIVRLTKAIDLLKEHQKNEYNVYIEKINVQSLTLDELNFSLENIDVNELSGAMNIGNTFSPTVGAKVKLPKEEKDKEGKIKKEMIKKLSQIKDKSKQQQPFSNQTLANHDIKVTINGKEVAHKVTD